MEPKKKTINNPLPAAASPFNLSDVVRFADPLPAVEMKLYPAAASNLARLKAAEVLSDAGNGWQERELIDQLTTRFREANATTTAQIFSETLTLPNELRVGDFAWATRLPTVEMAELRRVVNVLDMVVMPFSYMTPAAYEKESREIRAAIPKFNDTMRAGFNVYVAAPVGYYDVSRHVADAEDLPIYASDRVAPAFLAMNMALPMFRAIKQDLSQIRERTNEHTRRLGEAETQIRGIGVRLTQLSQQVERQQAEQIQQALRIAENERALREAEARSSFMAYEPMMVAIPKKRSVLDNGRVIVGPCWGPDFDALVMTALALRKFDGQREALRGVVASVPVPLSSRY